MRPRVVSVGAAGLMAALALAPELAAAQSSAVRPVDLVWHVENAAGETVDAKGSEVSFNPASVVKVATSLRALEQLGPRHRFETYFRAQGSIDPETGTLHGDLVVDGGGDPDFQPENAQLVAWELNRLGVRKVAGAVAVDTDFWTGWEGGSARPPLTDVARAERMARRLRDALDPVRWDRTARQAWADMAAARGLDPSRPPSVVVEGGVAVRADSAGVALLVHRSNPLPDVLLRFNSYSNNDIERLDVALGPAATLGPWLARRLDATADGLRIATSSGLGANRLTPRLVVGLMRAARDEARELGLDLGQVLPVAGCGPGTVSHLFPRIAATPGALVGKTGTLTETDGGVAVLAGIVATERQELLFCVAAPGVGARIAGARRAEERWLLELVARHGGATARPCTGTLPGPADHVQVEPLVGAGSVGSPGVPAPASR